MQLFVEIEGETEPPGTPLSGPDLVAFMSFAVVRGFGAQHPLIALADRLHDTHHVRLGPLTTFYEGRVDDAEDEEKLNMIWQPADELRDALDDAARAIEGDEQCRALLERARANALPAQIRELGEHIREAAGSGKRVRLSYEL